MSAKQTEGKITALYERLSRDDELIGDSNSVINQKIQLEEYAANHGFFNCQHYTDDGWSGGNFERPSWKRLIADIEAGKVGCVLAKDMSRIGRDYLQVGYFTEIVFCQNHVRFIAIGNGIDSEDPGTSEFAPFINIMSEWYLRDLSRKQRAAIKIKGESGKPTTNQAIYGYKKDPNDKYHWLVDEEAAAVVRRIYQLAVEGHGLSDIANILRNDKVKSPAAYLARQGRGPWKSKESIDRPYAWSDFVVGRILSKPEYMSHTVNFRSHKESYKDKQPIFHTPEDWLIFEKENINTLEMDSEMLITMMGAFAQAESESMSANIVWGKRQAMREGKTNVQFQHLYAYELDENGKPRIIPEQAAVVEQIYDSFLAGHSIRMIKKELESQGIPSAKGVQDNHEGIITRDRFNQAKAEFARRNAGRAPSQKLAPTGRSCYSAKYALTERLVCGECGTLYRRCVWVKRGQKFAVWRCASPDRLRYKILPRLSHASGGTPASRYSCRHQHRHEPAGNAGGADRGCHADGADSLPWFYEYIRH